MEISAVYSTKQLGELQHQISQIFDITRIVDPLDTSIVEFDDKGIMRKKQYECFRVWNRGKRCRKCTSLCSMMCNCAQDKYERIGSYTYYIISKPITVVDPKQRKHQVVLEIANRITETSILENMEQKSIIEVVQEIRNKIYVDSLTGVYNRRYFDEHQYLNKCSNLFLKKVAFLMIDLCKFKQVNDTYGHKRGDQLLQQVATSLLETVTDSDSVIRIGGDEFIVVLLDYEIEKLKQKVKEMEISIHQICNMKAHIGMAYTDEFLLSKEMVEQLLLEADKNMYKNKKNDV